MDACLESRRTSVEKCAAFQHHEQRLVRVLLPRTGPIHSASPSAPSRLNTLHIEAFTCRRVHGLDTSAGVFEGPQKVCISSVLIQNKFHFSKHLKKSLKRLFFPGVHEVVSPEETRCGIDQHFLNYLSMKLLCVVGACLQWE